MIWELTYAGVTQTFAAWGLKELKRSQVSQAVGGVSFTQSGAAFDGTPIFAIDELVTISQDGVPWHVGPVITTPCAASTRSESLAYAVADLWWYLENLPYTQTVYAGTTTRVALFSGADDALAKSSVQGVIVSAIALAVDAGAAMQVAFVGAFGVSPSVVDMRDPTCAEVIRQALRFAPDATMGWDYSTTPPTLRIATRAAATVRTLDVAEQASLNLVSITPRDDLRRDSVYIQYETTTVVDDETRVSYAVDVVGTGSPFRTLRATIELSGPNTQKQKQWLKSQTIPNNSETWWKRHVPHLQEATDLTITEHAEDPAEDDGESFSKELLEGQVPGWYDTDAVSGPMRVTAIASYKLTTAEGSEVSYKDDPISSVVQCTSLSTATYSRVASHTDGEAVPSGVAASLHAALSVLQYDVKIRVKKREVTFIARPGDVLNLIGGRGEWATMKAQVQMVSESVDGGETEITCGPPRHLSPQDLVEMLRGLRGKAPVNTLQERATGKKGEGSAAKGGRATQSDNGSAGSTHWHKVIAKSAGGTKTLILDAAEGVRVENSDGSYVDMQTGNNRIIAEDGAGAAAVHAPDKFSITDGTGKSIELTVDGLTISSGGDSTTLSLNHLFMQLAGATMSLTEEQMVIADGAGKTGTYEASSISLSDGGDTVVLDVTGGLNISIVGDTAELSPTRMQIIQTDDSVTVSPEGGLQAIAAAGQTAQISPAGGVFLDDADGGTVTLQTVPEEIVTMRLTNGSGEFGLPVVSMVLRGEEEAP